MKLNQAEIDALAKEHPIGFVGHKFDDGCIAITVVENDVPVRARVFQDADLTSFVQTLGTLGAMSRIDAASVVTRAATVLAHAESELWNVKTDLLSAEDRMEWAESMTRVAQAWLDVALAVSPPEEEEEERT